MKGEFMPHEIPSSDKIRTRLSDIEDWRWDMAFPKEEKKETISDKQENNGS